MESFRGLSKSKLIKQVEAGGLPSEKRNDKTSEMHFEQSWEVFSRTICEFFC